MKTSETHTPHKLGANRHDPAQKEHHAKNPSAESRDVREDRSTRKSKMVTSVPHQPSGDLRTNRQLLAREGDHGWAQALAETPARSAARKAVSLKLQHPGATQVFVAGTFNDWNPGIDRLHLNEAGEWTVDLDLDRGRHEYLFVADGCWLPDPNAGQWVDNPYGGRNSVIVF